MRYNYDQLSYVHNQFLYTAVGPGPANPPVIFGAPFGPNIPTASGNTSESTIVGDLSLQRKFNDNAMAYVTFARGYAPAAYNTANKLTLATSTAVTGALAPTPANLSDALARKESIDHLEIGTKGTYHDRRVTFNAALFDTKYKNFQIQIFDQNNTSINPPLILSNAGGAETRGLEVDTAIAATDRLRIDLNAAYTDAKFTDYRNAPCYYPAVPGTVPTGCTRPIAGGAVVQDLTGKVMPNAPELKFSLSAEQRVPLASGNELVLGANYTYRDSVQMLTDQNPFAIQPAVGILNVNFGMRTASSKTSVTLFVNNVTDKHYFTDLEDFWSAPWGGTTTVIGQPARDTNRYYGVRFSTGF
jgi:iron complex outermembrane receptor protein